MPLDPQAKQLLDRLAAMELPPTSSLTPREARAQMEAATLMLGPAARVARVEDRRIDGPGGRIRIRFTWPEGTGPFPCLVFFHGGGWVLGSIETHNGLCRAITHAAGVVVASVDYRLAPEHRFPAAVDDAFAATCWIAENAGTLDIDPERIAVGGDSAGGNLTAVVALKARDLGGPRLVHQLLIYPATNFDLDTPSYRQNAEGYMLTREDMEWFFGLYLSDPSDGSNPHVSPLRAPDLSGLPPAFVLTAEYDPLCDEGIAYARRLEEAGVPVRLSNYRGMIHGFLRRYNFLDQGRHALDEVAEVLRAAFGLT
jgi:acetyl esterase